MAEKNGILIIGAGGVGRVVVHKCVQNKAVFGKITLASRRLSSCERLQAEVGKENIDIAQVDADSVADLVVLIKRVQPSLVLNIALPYQDLTIMQACLETGTSYLDTANYEHPDTAKFEYAKQWAFDGAYKQKGITALLGSGFDPGVTNVFCAYAKQYLFDEIHYIDILDCNGGDHGYPFATNFNPEINLREVSSPGRYWENGRWIETAPMEIKMTWNYPQVGEKNSYLLYHEELESLVKNIPTLKRIRFFMTFGDSYLTHMKCLENVGMLRIDEVEHNGAKIVPIQFLKTLLPDPASLGARTVGKTNIGCVIEGVSGGKRKKIYIYNVCDHQEAFKETGAQAVSYTTGVPAAIGAKMLVQGVWSGAGVFNMEEFDAKPFMDELNKQGLPWVIEDLS
ncbi:MAG: saccharopine dehydrogenase family protein [Helicobacteraceae bacterium]